MQLVDEYYRVYNKIPSKDVLAEFFGFLNLVKKLKMKVFAQK